MASKNYTVTESYENLQKYKSIDNLKYTQMTKVDLIEIFINEDESLNLENILKWTKKIMLEHFNYSGEFEIISIPKKEDVENNYDEFVYDVLEPEYNRENIKYTRQAQAFLMLFIGLVFGISLFKSIDHNTIKAIFFITLGTFFYPKYMLTKNKIYLISMIAVLISGFLRIIK